MIRFSLAYATVKTIFSVKMKTLSLILFHIIIAKIVVIHCRENILQNILQEIQPYHTTIFTSESLSRQFNEEISSIKYFPVNVFRLKKPMI